ncbi:MAG: EpsD family peptidyl-prolyl cis-trans isomerase, partial [Aquabacterium sp.]
IQEELLQREALNAGLDRDPVVMQAMAAARREVLAGAWMARAADRAPAPEATAVRQRYDAQPALYGQRRVYSLQEFVIQATPEQVAALRARVARATRIEEVRDHLRAQGLAVKAHASVQPAEGLPPALLDRLSTMQDGQALLLAAPGGARIVWLSASRQASLTLAQAQPAIERALAAEARRAAMRSELDRLRSTARVQYYGRYATAAGPAASTSATPRAVAVPMASPSGSAPVVVDPEARARPSNPEDLQRALRGLR